ncbi:MAG: ABC transporter permease [Rhodocyclaceae bacterium]
MHTDGVRQRLLLLRLWTLREIRSRYAGSALGLVWAVILPLVTIALYYLVFAVVLSVRIPELSGSSGYFYYLLAGLIPWLTISEGLNRAVGAIAAHEQFLQKVVFPVEILPLSVLLASLLPQIVGSVLLFGLLGWSGHLANSALWLLPIALLAQLVISLGCGLALAALGMNLRDMVQAVPVVLQLLFYASPILYPRSMVPEGFQLLFMLNPFALLAETWQAALLGMPLSGQSLIALAVWTMLLGAGGVLLFMRLRPALSE